MKQSFYTVESVTSGHPDKICDQISDAILDAYLAGDSQSRVAVETFGSHGLLVVGGEVTSNADVDAAQIARDVYREIGHEDGLKIITNIIQQSPDIAQGVDTGGAGDQGIMYGYACDETPEFLPKGVVLAHRLTQGLENLRRNNPDFKWLGPDGKALVTLEDGKVKTVLVSAQHSKFVTQEAIRALLTERLIKPVIGDISGMEILINPTAVLRPTRGSPAGKLWLILTEAFCLMAVARFRARTRQRWTGRPLTWPALPPKTSWLTV